jgi:hypothetical protein
VYIKISEVVAFSPAKRYVLPEMGEEIYRFVEKAYDFVKQNPNLVYP